MPNDNALEVAEARIRAEFSPDRAFDLLVRIAAREELTARALEGVADETLALRRRVADLEAKAA